MKHRFSTEEALNYLAALLARDSRENEELKAECADLEREHEELKAEHADLERDHAETVCELSDLNNRMTRLLLALDVCLSPEHLTAVELTYDLISTEVPDADDED